MSWSICLTRFEVWLILLPYFCLTNVSCISPSKLNARQFSSALHFCTPLNTMPVSHIVSKTAAWSSIVILFCPLGTFVDNHCAAHYVVSARKQNWSFPMFYNRINITPMGATLVENSPHYSALHTRHWFSLVVNLLYPDSYLEVLSRKEINTRWLHDVPEVTSGVCLEPADIYCLLS